MMRNWMITVLLIGLSLTDSTWAASNEVNIYSARQEALIKPLLDRFTEQTGIEVNLVTGKADALLKRLQTEGRYSPADVLVTTDAGRLYRAKEAGLLQPIQSEILRQAIPESYRDPEGEWYGLSLRARTVVYAKDRVDPAQLSTYQALAEPRWKGRICVRSSDNIYNQSLVASMIVNLGKKQTEEWVHGLVRNFARSPQGGDRDQIKAVAVGQCDVALVNTYYLAMMKVSDDPSQREAADQVALFWLNQDGRGVHVNVSGAGITQASQNRANALRLLAFMASDEAQNWYAKTNHEYPVRPDIPISPVLQEWGDFKKDSLNLSLLGQYNAEAVKLMDRAGWR